MNLEQLSVTLSADDAQLQTALTQANLPTLLLVLAHVTRDPKWLEEPYRPTRTLALHDNDTGGLPDNVQQEIRAAAFDTLRALRDGNLELPAPPQDDDVIKMLSISLGESIPPEYATTMAEEAGFRPRGGTAWSSGTRPASADKLNAVIIGAGPSGIAAAATLAKLGIRYTIVEKSDAVGGVWRDNDYPGAGVDTPTHMYSFSFAPRRGWTRYYAKQPEILDYIQQTARDFGVVQNIRFRTEVTKMAWDEEAQLWHVSILEGDGSHEVLDAPIVISCVGQLSRPSTPSLPGMGLFEGPMFHSARWDHEVDLTGKRVAVIGAGATAMQIVPAIADTAEKVLVFQRSPQWIAPNPNYLRDVPDGTRLLMEQVPYYADFYRLRLNWQFQDKLLASLYRDPEWPHPERSVSAANDKHRIFFTKYLDEQLGDRTDLREKVLPDYPPYGKRILMDNNWFKTIKRDDVELITDAIAGFDEHHVLTADGAAHEADIVVLATGFQTSRMLWPMDICGRSGVSLHEQWGDDDASAYVGVSVPNFPNLFIVGGPHTALGHGGSAIYSTECSVSYISQLLIQMVERGLNCVEVKPDVAEEFNKRIDAEHERLIWTHPGMTNWYSNAAGRVVAAMPWRNVDYWTLTRTPDLEDYIAK
ncbi:flavin-containing monooxygenase [Rhodococcus chondri]|uniref:NAD(P)/FAD-dependent oxidoreductase n=1 Tax=Rhodococcus chondri TaxID=3065941 RepID=A0ABU7JU45_9NOCA|nr:NAD(P)/FAD-dependent oxidoreductase [Rhodococcus sp. CC-R104]MEE2033029.1 NAD(P)/FAD-dependent oxidoreductase [Rhodococcus sp. CC-R104]